MTVEELHKMIAKKAYEEGYTQGYESAIAYFKNLLIELYCKLDKGVKIDESK